MDWKFETNMFQEAAYGTTTIALDLVATVASAVLTILKARIIKLYHNRCLRSDFEPLSTKVHLPSNWNT